MEGASVGNARRMKFTRESGPWLLVPGFLGLPEGRYEFPVLLLVQTCVSLPPTSVYFYFARVSVYKYVHGRVFAMGVSISM